MSQEMFLRKIPEDMRPWECNVNGVKFVYPAGTEQNVPYEVAVLIDKYWAEQEVDYPETGISYNDLKDKPFYESTEVLFDQRVTFDRNSAEVAVYVWGTKGKLPLEDGDRVIVTFEGETYTVPVMVDTIFTNFGNSALSSSAEYGNGFPFYVNNTGNLISIFTYGPITTDVKIERIVVHTIAPKYMPNGGAGVGYENTEVIHNGEINIPDVTNGFDGIQNITLDIAVGDTLRITWVDEEYVCSVADMDGALLFGNMAMADGEDTGEPFFFGILPGIGTLVQAADGPGLYYCKIVKEEVHTIDPKFLPSICFHVNVWYESGVGYVADKTYAEIKAAEAAKTPVVGTFTLHDGKVFTLIGCDESAYDWVNLAAIELNHTPDVYVYRVMIYEDGSVEVSGYSLTGTAISASNFYPK